MKKLVVILSVFSSYFVSAQQSWSDVDIQQYFQKKGKGQETLVVPKDKWQSLIQGIQTGTAKFSHTLTNGDKIYLLAQDNMPCIVPEMSHYKMPDGRKGVPNMFWNIPNGSPKVEIIPKEKNK